MNYIFVDESGDPGKPYKIVGSQKIATGASKYYIVTALSVTSSELFLLEQEIISIKHRYKFCHSCQFGICLFNADERFNLRSGQR